MKILSEPLSIDYLDIEIPGLSQLLQGKKLVQLSDFHYDGLLLSEELLTQTITASNQINPDLVLLTGDFVTHNPKPIYQLKVVDKQLHNHQSLIVS